MRWGGVGVGFNNKTDYFTKGFMRGHINTILPLLRPVRSLYKCEEYEVHGCHNAAVTAELV